MKLRGDDSCMGRSTGLCLLMKKKACEEARQVRSAQKGMCMLGGPGKGGKVTVHKQLLRRRMSGKREHAHVIFSLMKYFSISIPFAYRRIENNG